MRITRPTKLKLRDGIKWTGHVKVFPADGKGRYFVKFDARDSGGGQVYDQYSFTRELVIDWTGFDPVTGETAL